VAEFLDLSYYVSAMSTAGRSSGQRGYP